MPRYEVHNDGIGPYAIFYCDKCSREYRSQPDVGGTIAQDIGLRVDKRSIRVTELADFVEVGACGTAVVITPVSSILHDKRLYTFGREDEAGKTLTKLYTEITGIQYGEIPDRHGWMRPVNFP